MRPQLPPDGFRILFLDDDPSRAAAFLGGHPDAVWVQTADECLARLAEPWDEVHLDHDLGGEVHVDHDRVDCGMGVVRWLDLEPRPYLQAARFFVHTHNLNAACLMALHLQGMGFTVEVRPFAMDPPGTSTRRPLASRVLRRLRSFWGRRPAYRS